MSRPDSIAFRALDHHVITGRADAPALVTPQATLTYAQLLHESAAFAGGLRDLSLTAGSAVRLKVPDRRIWVIGVLAIVRIGAEPDREASFTITEDPAVVRAGEHELGFDAVLHAGRVEPARARLHDDGDYGERMTRKFGDVLATLLHGGTLT